MARLIIACAPFTTCYSIKPLQFLYRHCCAGFYVAYPDRRVPDGSIITRTPCVDNHVTSPLDDGLICEQNASGVSHVLLRELRHKAPLGRGVSSPLYLA